MVVSGEKLKKSGGKWEKVGKSGEKKVVKNAEKWGKVGKSGGKW